MQTIRAAVCHEFGAPLAVEGTTLNAPQHGEIAVTLAAVAICHSDISCAEGAWSGTLPEVFGHEAAGRISALDSGVSGLKVGEHVIVTLIRACGDCSTCASGQPAYCQTNPSDPAGPLRTANGGALTQAMSTGGFAEKVVVHTSQVVRIGPEIPLDAASLVACGVITGVGAVINAAGLKAGQDVVVIGAGGVGLNAIKRARIAGARGIVAVGMSQDKLRIAKDFGATDGVLATQDKPWRAASEALGGKGAEAVIVTVGAIPAYDQAPRYLDTGGKVIIAGMPQAGDETRYEPVVFASLGQSMVSSKTGDVVIQRDIPWMVDLYTQGRMKLDKLISSRWTLEQTNKAIADTMTGAARRNVIVFDI